MHLRAWNTRSFEANSNFYPFEGVNGNDRLSDPSIQLAVPSHMAAQSNMQSSNDTFHHADDCIAFCFHAIDQLYHFKLRVFVCNSNGRLFRYLNKLIDR